MSRSIDLFIESANPAEEVAQQISRLSGFTLQPGPKPETWCLDEGGVHAELAVNHYVDDGDLPLGRYGYSLSARVPSDKRLADAPETSLLRVVSEALQKGGLATLVVHDLQYRDQQAARTAGQSESSGRSESLGEGEPGQNESGQSGSSGPSDRAPQTEGTPA